MTHTLHFLPEVEDDVIGGYVWYEKKSPGLGEEFLRMVYASAGELLRNPLQYPKVHNEFQRCLLRRFPYAIYFRTSHSRVIVFGLFHCARNPRTIKANLRSRKKR